MTPRERLDRMDSILCKKISSIEDEARRQIDRITDQRVKLRIAWLREEVNAGKGYAVLQKRRR